MTNTCSRHLFFNQIILAEISDFVHTSLCMISCLNVQLFHSCIVVVDNIINLWMSYLRTISDMAQLI